MRIISGQFKGRLLKTPKGPQTRPTQGVLREALFNICQNEIVGARLLDLFAGSGAIGFEALSRGAAHVTFVEKDRFALVCLQENIEMLGVLSQVSLLKQEARVAIERLKEPFDLVYLDPPYDMDVEPLINQLLKRELLKDHGLLFLEERYTPKPPPSFPPLLHLNSRRFGIALLHQYTKKIPG